MKTLELANRHRGPARQSGAAPIPKGLTAGPHPAVRQILHAPHPQAKLTVGAPDDAFEREANQVADQVMRMPEAEVAITGAPPRVQRLCAHCEKEKKDEGIVQRQCDKCEEQMQAKEEPGKTPAVPGGFEQRFAVLHGNGRPLPAAERAFFEPHFGRDFASVHLHSGPVASELARSVHARAFTLGNSIVLGDREYAPGTGAGRQILAHELTHVLQQANPRSLQVQRQAAPRMLRPAETRASGEATATTGHRFSPECTNLQRCRVIEPLVHARQLVHAVLAQLQPVAAGTVITGRIIDLLNVHFHTASVANVSTILERFQAIRSELNAPIRFVCHNDNPPDCRPAENGVVGGYTTCAASADVHLCAGYYGLSCEQQARVLVHEVAHHVPSLCEDHAYVHDSSYSTLPPTEAMGNPDSYAQFATMVFRGAPRCIDCGLAIQLGGRQY